MGLYVYVNIHWLALQSATLTYVYIPAWCNIKSIQNCMLKSGFGTPK